MEELKLEEIINKDHIESILKEYDGEEQLQELKNYLFPHTGELKEIGIDPSSFAWQLYKANIKVKKQ